MPGQFDLQQSFPIASVAQLIAQRPEKEYQAKSQQVQQLMQGIQLFGQGVDSLVKRRQAMAQALAQANIYSQSPQGQQDLGTNTVTQSPMGSPVQQNQTAAYDPTTGLVTQNAPKTNIDNIANALYGTSGKDFLSNIAEQNKQSQDNTISQGTLALAQKTKPQEIANEARRNLAAEQNNAILRQLQERMGMATIENQNRERDQADARAKQEADNQNAERAQAAENASRESDKAILGSGSAWNPFNPVTRAQKETAAEDLANHGRGPVGQSATYGLPTIGNSITLGNGVTIKRHK